MTDQAVRKFLACHAPEAKVVELVEAHTTDLIARAWNVLPAQVAKTLALRVAEHVAIVVACGDARLDNRKMKEVLGGKGQLLTGPEASEITGHPVGGITPLCLARPLPVFFDIRLQRFEEVVTAGGSTHVAVRISPERFAHLVAARWVDVCRDV